MDSPERARPPPRKHSRAQTALVNADESRRQAADALQRMRETLATGRANLEKALQGLREIRSAKPSATSNSASRRNPASPR